MRQLQQQDDGASVTLELEDGCTAEARYVARNGRAELVEVRIVAPDDGEIGARALRGVTKTKMIAALRKTRGGKYGNAGLHGRRRSEDLLVLVAIVYARAREEGVTAPSQHVWEVLTDLHRIEQEEDYADPVVVGRAYTRSAVRTLIRDARKRGYLIGTGSRADPVHVSGNDNDLDWPTVATLHRPRDRNARFSASDGSASLPSANGQRL